MDIKKIKQNFLEYKKQFAKGKPKAKNDNEDNIFNGRIKDSNNNGKIGFRDVQEAFKASNINREEFEGAMQEILELNEKWLDKYEDMSYEQYVKTHEDVSEKEFDKKKSIAKEKNEVLQDIDGLADKVEKGEVRLLKKWKTERTSKVGIQEDNSKGSEVVKYAMQFVGNRYVYGGSSLTNGCDCSGFVMRVYEHFGIPLPHSSSADMSVGNAVGSVQDAKPGDVMCFPHHVAIYIGNGKIVHAESSRTGIVVTDLARRRTPPTAIRRLV